MLDAAMAELHRLRALAGWPAKAWKADSLAHGEHLLDRIREGLSIDEALDAVRATVWKDSLACPDDGHVALKLASGGHATLTRIFRPTRGGQRGRVVEEWIEAGRPAPASRRPAALHGARVVDGGRINANGSFTPTGKYTAADIFEET